MKKLNFTFGLALSMFILGASVLYAQNPETLNSNSVKRAGGIKISATVTGCNFYAGPVELRLFLDATGILGFHEYGGTNTYLYSYPDIKEEGKVFNLYAPTGDTYSWYFGGYAWNYGTNEFEWSTVGSLLYLQKANAEADVKIFVPLAYVVGNELRPVITRTITYGEWYPKGDDMYGNYRSVNYAPNPPVALPISIREFHPIEDRETGILDFTFIDDILDLMAKNPPIYSIHYDISVHQEYGTPGQNYYETPTATDVTTQYALQFFIQDGIKTDPLFYEDQLVFVKSQEDFVFTVISPSMPTVKTNPTRMDNWRQPILPDVIDNLDGTFTVTIQHVNKAMKVSIAVENDVELESGETGNAAVAADAVWAAGGTLYVQAANPATLSIYTVTGQLYKQATVSGSASFTLPKGLYIVQLNGKAYKIVI